MTAARRIFDDVIDNLEAMCREQIPIVLGIKARVVELFSLKRAEGFSRARTACEHQCAAVRDMRGKDREHRPLLVLREMEETVPSENAIEATADIEPAHIGDHP